MLLEMWEAEQSKESVKKGEKSGEMKRKRKWQSGTPVKKNREARFGGNIELKR